MLGRRLIWLHTYGERFELSDGKNGVPVGSAKCIEAMPVDSAKYPESFNYKPGSKELDVGGGRFSPVAPEVWDFEVSGLKVVQSWLAYRMKKRAGKKSSELDQIRPGRWIPRMTDEFLELLWVIEATLAMESELATMLDQIVRAPCLKADDLPQPTPVERKPPIVLGDDEEQPSLLYDEDAEDGQAA
jgi:hypothetical protein